MNWIDVEFGYEEGYRRGKCEAASSISVLGAVIKVLLQLLMLALTLFWHIAIAVINLLWYLCQRLPCKQA